jgi:hypothetical protein
VNAHHLFDIKDILHYQFIPQGQTVNQAYYMEIPKWLQEVVRRKKPELWPNDWILHHQNASTHKVLSSNIWPITQLLKLSTHSILFLSIPLIWL